MAHAIDLSGQDILGYLAAHERKDLLRFITCGSVDDGKSTLIGRLLYESKLVYEDQLAALDADSKKHGTQGEELDLALLVDGLAAEREQGITIDVAYRFFSTAQRKFIVADTPGHEQYTRNMVTGASTADLAVILVDARKGVLTQTRRHSYIVSLLGIRHVVLAVNKMDAVDYAEDAFNAILASYLPFARQLGMDNVTGIPVSALKGDNILQASERMPWYRGPALMQHLESVEVEERAQHAPFRLPVQWVNRPSPDFRGFAGQIASGRVNVGDRIRVLPSGAEARVARIVTFDGDLTHAVAGQSMTLTLDREIDVSRGDLIASSAEAAEVADQFEATLIWMHEQPLQPGRQYLMKIGTRAVNATPAAPRYRVNVNTLEQQSTAQLELNEIGLCQITLDRPVAFDPYAQNRETGGFILIDKLSNDTVGAGLLQGAVRRADNLHWQTVDVTRAARAQLKGQRACVLWFTGASAATSAAIAQLVEKRLHALGRHTYLLDAQAATHLLGDGQSTADPAAAVRRVAQAAGLMVDAGLIVLVCFAAPTRALRALARRVLADSDFLEIAVEAPAPGDGAAAYEAPENPAIRTGAPGLSHSQAAERIIAELDRSGVIAYAYNNPLAGL